VDVWGPKCRRIVLVRWPAPKRPGPGRVVNMSLCACRVIRLYVRVRPSVCRSLSVCQACLDAATSSVPPSAAWESSIYQLSCRHDHHSSGRRRRRRCRRRPVSRTGLRKCRRYPIRIQIGIMIVSECQHMNVGLLLSYNVVCFR